MDINGSSATGNAVRGNSIFANGGPGITLTNGAVSFSNEYPTLTILRTGATTPVAGSFQGVPNTTYRIDIFANNPHVPGDTTPYDGQFYLGSFTVGTDATGAAVFKDALPGASNSNDVFTATVTVSGYNTNTFAVLPAPTAPYTPPTVAIAGPKAEVAGMPAAFTSIVTDSNPGQPQLTYSWSVTAGVHAAARSRDNGAGVYFHPTRHRQIRGPTHRDRRHRAGAVAFHQFGSRRRGGEQ